MEREEGLFRLGRSNLRGTLCSNLCTSRCCGHNKYLTDPFRQIFNRLAVSAGFLENKMGRNREKDSKLVLPEDKDLRILIHDFSGTECCLGQSCTAASYT